MYYTWNKTHTIETRKNVGVLVWYIPPLVLSPHASQAASPGQYVWYAQLSPVPKAAAILTSKDQTTSVIVIKGEDLPIQVFTEYLSF